MLPPIKPKKRPVSLKTRLKDALVASVVRTGPRIILIAAAILIGGILGVDKADVMEIVAAPNAVFNSGGE